MSEYAGALREALDLQIDEEMYRQWMTPEERKRFDRRLRRMRDLDLGQLVELLKRRESRR